MLFIAMSHRDGDSNGPPAKRSRYEELEDHQAAELIQAQERAQSIQSQIQHTALQNEILRSLLLPVARPPAPLPSDDMSLLLQNLLSGVQQSNTWGNPPNLPLPPASIPHQLLNLSNASLSLQGPTTNQSQESQILANLLRRMEPQAPAPSPPQSNLSSLLASLLGTGTTPAYEANVPLSSTPNSSDLLSSLVQQATAARADRVSSHPEGEVLHAAASALSTFLSSGIDSNLASKPVQDTSTAATASTPVERARGRVIPLALATDKTYVSEYQMLLREQIDLFEATEGDLMARAQGRNKPIQLNSVGIRCHHCAALHPGFRPRGAVYFPTKLIGLYHSSQNMAANHFSGACSSTPEHIIKRLAELRQSKAVVYGRCSQRYWEQAAEKLGVREEDGRLVFSDAVESSSSSVAPSNESV